MILDLHNVSRAKLRRAKQEAPCRGVIARFIRNCYYREGGWVRYTHIRPLRTMSCHGCPQCRDIYQTIQSDAQDGLWPVEMDDFFDGDLVRVVQIPGSREVQIRRYEEQEHD